MGRDDKDRRDLHSNCSNARRFVANVFSRSERSHVVLPRVFVLLPARRPCK